LLIQAHCLGALDLGTADLSDPRWWKKAHFIGDYLERDAIRKLDEYKYQLNLAVLDYRQEASTFNLHMDQATSLRNKLIAGVMPWVDTGPVDMTECIESMRQQYIEAFGDPADPAYQEEIARTCAYLRRGEQ
jgi:hypothetical protein